MQLERKSVWLLWLFQWMACSIGIRATNEVERSVPFMQRSIVLQERARNSKDRS
jgi:hypothetical protein